MKDEYKMKITFGELSKPLKFIIIVSYASFILNIGYLTIMMIGYYFGFFT